MKWIKNCYQKILNFCGTRHVYKVLATLSFTESCCFVIPPEVLMMPMAYADRKVAWKAAFVTTLFSVFGAIAGYFMGHWLWEMVSGPLFSYIPGFAKYFDEVGKLYHDNAVEALFLAAFTPIPFKVFTVAAGVYSSQVSLFTLIWVSIVGRGLRYYGMVAVVYYFGEHAKVIIEKHFVRLTYVVMILVLLLIVYKNFLHKN